MLTYLALFSALMVAVVLAAVVLSDRWEREPLELVQGCYSLGFMYQLLVTLPAAAWTRGDGWSVVLAGFAVLAAAVAVPLHMAGRAELDEPYDGIVYSVAFMSGAGCLVHLWGLPAVIGGSAHPRLWSVDVVGVRDLGILLAAPAAGRSVLAYLVLIAAAALGGSAFGSLHCRGASRSSMVGAGAAVSLVVWGLNRALGHWWPVGVGTVLAAVAVAWALKRRSPFRAHAEHSEGDLVVKTVNSGLLVLGSVTLALVLLACSDGAGRFDDLVGPPAGTAIGGHSGEPE